MVDVDPLTKVTQCADDQPWLLPENPQLMDQSMFDQPYRDMPITLSDKEKTKTSYL